MIDALLPPEMAARAERIGGEKIREGRTLIWVNANMPRRQIRIQIARLVTFGG
jgi:hypothetical protein